MRAAKRPTGDDPGGYRRTGIQPANGLEGPSTERDPTTSGAPVYDRER